MDKFNDRVEQRKRPLPPPILEDQPVTPSLPASFLHRRLDMGEGNPPLEHRTHSASPEDRGVQPPETQVGFSHVDRVSGACISSVTHNYR